MTLLTLLNREWAFANLGSNGPIMRNAILNTATDVTGLRCFMMRCVPSSHSSGRLLKKEWSSATTLPTKWKSRDKSRKCNAPRMNNWTQHTLWCLLCWGKNPTIRIYFVILAEYIVQAANICKLWYVLQFVLRGVYWGQGLLPLRP